MKKEEFTQMAEPLTNEIETMVLTTGKPHKLILSSNKLLFTIYEVMFKGKKWFALVAYEDAFKLIGADKKGSGLLLFCREREVIIYELVKILASFEDNGILAA